MAGGVAPGGALTQTDRVDNFPGFSRGIEGQDLMVAMREQSVWSGTRILAETVSEVQMEQHPFEIRTENGRKVHTQALIVATGAIANRLGVPGEEKYWTRGVSACAVCDGALPIFRDRPVVVVGGGDTACEEALFLSRYCSQIYMLVRRDVMRASKIMQKRVEDESKVKNDIFIYIQKGFFSFNFFFFLMIRDFEFFFFSRLRYYINMN